MSKKNSELNYNNYTATDARRLASDVCEEKDKEQLEKVLKLINDYSNRGEFVFSMFDERLRENVKNDLEIRGFDIHEVPGGNNETDTIIKW